MESGDQEKMTPTLSHVQFLLLRILIQAAARVTGKELRKMLVKHGAPAYSNSAFVQHMAKLEQEGYLTTMKLQTPRWETHYTATAKAKHAVAVSLAFYHQPIKVDFPWG